MGTVQVQRLGHVNQFVEDHSAVEAFHTRVLGAETFSDWEEADFGGRNALLSVGPTVLELFSPTTPDKAIGQWLASNGSGWHSLEWTVPSLSEAVEVLAERGIRVTDSSPGNYVFTHPKDAHGLCLELTDKHFPGDRRDEPGAAAGNNPLGITGPVVVGIASNDPDAAAAWLADLVGADGVQAEDRRHMNTRAVGVAFADHVVEFVTPLATPAEDHLSDFLREKGERIYAVTFPVVDFYEARAQLSRADVRFEQFGRDTLVLPREETGGVWIELRTAAS